MDQEIKIPQPLVIQQCMVRIQELESEIIMLKAQLSVYQQAPQNGVKSVDEDEAKRLIEREVKHESEDA